MSGRFVRASKYRHVFGRSTKKEQCYDNLRISKNAWDTNLIKANPKYISVNWEASGGGAFAVIPIDERGRAPDQLPLFRGHTAAVLDTDWSPFNDSLIASGSDDGKVCIWKVPENFTLRTDAEEPEDVKPIGKLSGHTRKVGHVLFNPSAENVLASSSGDYTIKVWDVEAGSPRLTLKHGDIVQSLSWNATGSMIATTCRDKKLRLWDVRQEKPAHEVAGHPGAKNSRAVWLGELDRVATTGFSKMSDRQLAIWDTGAPREPIGGFQILDSISGVCMPFWDDGTKILYLAGKGDGMIRYYEYSDDKLEYLSEYKSADPQRGIAFLPKRGVNMHENELMRAFKTVNDAYIEPVSFIVPRRAETFQGDVYPPTVGLKSAVSSGEWFSGKTGLPPKINLESLYENGAVEEVPSDYQPPISTPAPVKEPEKPKPAPEPVEPTPVRREPPPSSMNESKVSMGAMADKFADRDEPADDHSDASSSFEEIPKPVERPAVTAAKIEEKVSSPPVTKAPPRADPIPATTPINGSSAPASVPSPAKTSTEEPAPPPESRATGQRSASGAAAGLAGHLSDIKALLEAQRKQMESQTDQIRNLSNEVEMLKGRVGDGAQTPQVAGDREREMSERIRQLELELEEARG
ncbi:MAG: Coronin-like protein crn1 [Bogoriella megaspora]|nr:MAG: Coronin-like protein crn1 [Bogoriella megaspora]